MEVCDLAAADAAGAAALHAAQMPDHFLAGAGEAFLRRYHRAFARPPGLALVVRGDAGEVRGVLIGCLDATAFYRQLLRRDGVALAAAAAIAAVRRPSWGAALLRTRGLRYTRALWRRRPSSAKRGASGATAPPSGTLPSGALPSSSSSGTAEAMRVGEITMIVVDPTMRRSGYGKALMEAACQRARASGVDRMDLVTPADDAAAQAFYVRLGWQDQGTAVSASGERFRRYSMMSEAS